MGLGSVLKAAVSGNAGSLYDALMADIDSQADKLIGDKKTAGRVKKFGRKSVAATGGGIGLNYQYARDKGMDDSEAQKTAWSGGYLYKDARGEQIARIAEGEQAQRDAEFSRRESLALRKERGQIAARVRRRRPTDRSNAAAQAPGATLGAVGSGPSEFATLLGL